MATSELYCNAPTPVVEAVQVDPSAELARPAGNQTRCGVSGALEADGHLV